MRVSSIVEGDGEVEALPVLLRRLALWKNAATKIDPLRPIRVKRNRFLNRDEELNRHLQLAGAKCGEDGWILVLLDADDDCPADLGSTILLRARAMLPHRKISVVLANREFEAWYIGAALSLNGRRGLVLEVGDDLVDPERPRDAKGWLAARMPAGYGETTDQPAFAARMDLQMAFDRCRSFRKLCTEWDKHCGNPTD
jgi:hypothetical protein